MSWSEAVAELNAAIADETFGFGSAITYNGAACKAVIAQRVEPWFTEAGSEVREVRYELLVPEAELSSAPAEGDVIVDGAATYDVIYPGALEQGLWRAAIRKREG